MALARHYLSIKTMIQQSGLNIAVDTMWHGFLCNNVDSLSTVVSIVSSFIRL